MEKYLRRLCKNIIADKFNDEKYRQRRNYYGIEIQTLPLFCSYGTIGFTATIFTSCSQYKVECDWELRQLTIDGLPWKDMINLLYLSNNDINQQNDEPVWGNHPHSVELECYTDGGEDMIIYLEKPTKEKLQEYIDNFDINENVSMWWEGGRPGRGVPFDNMKEHYEDYEAYLKRLQKVCDKMPY